MRIHPQDSGPGGALYVTEGAQFFGGLDVISDPPALDAYREYRAGLELFARDYPKALAHLQRASELEPSFWLPQAIQYYAYSNLREPQQAGAVIQNLLARRDRLRPPERLFIDYLQSIWEARTAEAFRALSDVETIVPHSWGVNYMLIYLSLGLNRPRSVLDLYHRPAFADPPLPMQPVALWRMTALVEALHLLGDHERELEQARIVERRAPGEPTVVSFEGAALAALQRVEDVNLAIDRRLATAGDNGNAATLMIDAALELRAHGQPQASRAIAARTVNWLKTRPAETAETDTYRAALALAHYLQDRWDEAAGLFSRLHDERPNDVQYWGYMGAIAARKGDVAAANAVSAGLGRLRDRSLFGEPTYWRARIAALLGHRQEAVDLLREAFAQGYLFSQFNVHACPDFEVLAADPAFRQLVRPEAPPVKHPGNRR